MIKFMAIKVIKLYQVFISPRKGYRCAHSVLHGGSGCSGAVIDIISNNRLIDCPKLIKQRFSDCKDAYQTIQDRRKNRSCDGLPCNSRNCDLALDCGDCDVGSCDI